MPNFMITTACNFRCSYCFGLNMVGPGHPAVHMQWDVFLDLLRWIRQSSDPVPAIHFMGGEPTLNPLFGAMLNRGIEEGFRVKVFSNLSAPIDVRILHEAREKDVTWIVNVNPLPNYRDNQLALLTSHLDILRDRAALTFNVTPQSLPYRHILDFIGRHGLQKTIKLGVALPTMEKNNFYVSRDRFTEVADTVMEIFDEAGQMGVGLQFECGVPYCIFSDKQISRLEGIAISTCCSRLDITPDGRIINCLPLCNLAAVPHTRFRNYGDAAHWYKDALAPYRSLGSQADCLDCIHRTDGKCFACLAFGLDGYDRIVLPPLPN